MKSNKKYLVYSLVPLKKNIIVQIIIIQVKIYLKGISEYSQLKNIKLSIHFLDPSITSINSDNFKEILNLYAKLWDGIIMIHPLPKEVVDYLVLRYPCVSTVEQRSSVNLNCIDLDHYQGMSYLIDYLL